MEDEPERVAAEIAGFLAAQVVAASQETPA
jgi:hypothetical protein